MTHHDFEIDDLTDTLAFGEEGPDEQSLFIVELDDALQDKLAGTKWEERLSLLSEDTPWEERITLYQALRAEEVFPAEACYFLIVWAIESLAQSHIDELYNAQYAARVDKMRRQHGLSEEDEWGPGEGPAEFQQLEAEFSQAVEAILRATYQHVGEHQIAELIDKDPEEAQRRYEAGNDFIQKLFDEQV